MAPDISTYVMILLLVIVYFVVTISAPIGFCRACLLRQTKTRGGRRLVYLALAGAGLAIAVFNLALFSNGGQLAGRFDLLHATILTWLTLGGWAMLRVTREPLDAPNFIRRGL